MVKYEQVTQKGVGLLNEDAIINHPAIGIFGVLDGVSSLVPYLNDKKETGGYIAANFLKGYFESLSEAGNLKKHIEIANKLLRAQMREAKIDIERKDGLWGTALALVRIREDVLEFIQTGDCMILVIYEDGEVRTLTWKQVAHLEVPALRKWKEGVVAGLKTREELMESVIDILRKNRYLSNSKGGYGVLNGGSDAVRFLEYGKINLTGVKQVILLTDGMFWPESLVPKQKSYWSFVAEQILTKGIVKYMEDLIEVEENDPECLKYPRFKKSDDKTGVVITL